MNDLVTSTLHYIAAHPTLAIFIIGATSFGESFAFLSLLFPGTTILVAAGALIKAHAIDPVSAALAGSIGAIVGDAISFWIGQRFGAAVPRLWPFSRHPELLFKGMGFFRCYGWASVFIGRFFGPFRAVVPLVAGMMKMPTLPFYIANCLSAFIWAPALLFSGYLLDSTIASSWHMQGKIVALLVGGLLVLALILWARRIIRVS